MNDLKTRQTNRYKLKPRAAHTLGRPSVYPFRELPVGGVFRVRVGYKTPAYTIQRRIAAHAARYKALGVGTFSTRHDAIRRCIVVTRIS